MKTFEAMLQQCMLIVDAPHCRCLLAPRRSLHRLGSSQCHRRTRPSSAQLAAQRRRHWQQQQLQQHQS
eukprot:5185-Heterococcus_DN1.PRE.2